MTVYKRDNLKMKRPTFYIAFIIKLNNLIITLNDLIKNKMINGFTVIKNSSGINYYAEWIS